MAVQSDTPIPNSSRSGLQLEKEFWHLKINCVTSKSTLFPSIADGNSKSGKALRSVFQKESLMAQTFNKVESPRSYMLVRF